MSVYWGVDSSAAANATPPGLSGATVWAYVVTNFGTPAFWGRYIGGSYALTPGEASFLHSNNCKILVIYNGTTPTSVSGTYQDGVNDANAAISAATTLSIPSGVCIFADIEASWSPTSEWIQGWSDTMFGSIYRGAGGIYGDTGETTFDSPYCAAWNADEKMQTGPSFVYASEPEPGCTTQSAAPTWGADAPSCNPTYTIAWQYAEGCGAADCWGYTCFDEDEVNGVVGYACLW